MNDIAWNKYTHGAWSACKLLEVPCACSVLTLRSCSATETLESYSAQTLTHRYFWRKKNIEGKQPKGGKKAENKFAVQKSKLPVTSGWNEASCTSRVTRERRDSDAAEKLLPEGLAVAPQKGNPLVFVIKHDLHTCLFVISALKWHYSTFSGFAISEWLTDNQATIPLSLKPAPSHGDLEWIRY